MINYLLKGKSTLALLEKFGWLDSQMMDTKGQMGKKKFPFGIFAIFLDHFIVKYAN